MSATTRTGFAADLWERIVPTFDAILAHPFLTGISDGTPAAGEVRLLHRAGHALPARLLARAVLRRRPCPGLRRHRAVHQLGGQRDRRRGGHARRAAGRLRRGRARSTTRASRRSGELYVNTVLMHAATRPVQHRRRRRPGLLLDLRRGRQGPDRAGLARPALPALDRHLRRPRVRGDGRARCWRSSTASARRPAPAERERMARIFEQGCLLEWMFWDAAWRLETWPVPAA